MRLRLCVLALFCAVPLPAYADPMDDIRAAIFEGNFANGKAEIKDELRQCSYDYNCVAVMSLCRWRPVNTKSEQMVSKVSAQLQLECKWPPPPENAPAVVCVDNLCQITPDGKYY